VHRFIPECQKVRSTLEESRRILEPVIERERARRTSSKNQGPLKQGDTINWLHEVAAGRPYDLAVAQLTLSFAAIHTTTELLSGIISDLCAHPEAVESMRQEVQAASSGKAWTKQTLSKLKLMDSVMKESQRHHFGSISAMMRYAEQPVRLPDGTTIPKGALTIVGMEAMNDEKIFPEPFKYKPRRFLEMRQRPGQENRWHFVTTSPEHLAFGHGKHACPGRFFAANEIKIILTHLLMKYDWMMAPEGLRKDEACGVQTNTDPEAKVMLRARKSEVQL
jgi:cytochrome P450